MPLNNISFNLGKGGLGRPLPGEDHISGLLFYSGSLPSGFSSSARIRQFASVADAEAAGILKDYSDGTSATATYLITALGGASDSIKITVNEPLGVVTTLCNYSKVAGDSTIALLGASIAAAINAGTSTHGYVASFTTATLTITAPKRLGAALNSNSPLVVTITGTIAGTITQFTGGVGSKLAVMWYHISEFFRQNAQGILFVGIYAVPGSYTFTEITTMQQFANGKIRQIGVYKDSAAFTTADITAIHNVCATNVANHQEIVALYGADISAVSDLTTLSDCSALTAFYCTPVIGQDGAGFGAFLYANYGKSITVLGAAIGALSAAKVSHSIAWVGRFNMSDGTELDVPAIANGTTLTNATISQTLLNQIQDKAYLFLRKFTGISGSYFNENRTSVVSSSPYAYITDNRVMQKATRSVYLNVLPALNSPITLNSDGTLSDEAIAYFTGLSETGLNQMVRDGELSAFAVSINASQSVASTGKLTINISLVEIATGRNIEVNIGFNVSI